jgi:hypothetical protein
MKCLRFAPATGVRPPTDATTAPESTPKLAVVPALPTPTPEGPATKSAPPSVAPKPKLPVAAASSPPMPAVAPVSPTATPEGFAHKPSPHRAVIESRQDSSHTPPAKLTTGGSSVASVVTPTDTRAQATSTSTSGAVSNSRNFFKQLEEESNTSTKINSGAHDASTSAKQAISTGVPTGQSHKLPLVRGAIQDLESTKTSPIHHAPAKHCSTASEEVLTWLTLLGLEACHSRFMNSKFDRLDAIKVCCGLICVGNACCRLYSLNTCT